ncbi:hypothetical protein QMK17_16925 [Rhodococcus sp. G-MC3]|uniref:hypothetical protein n=1 Tax=Rhodococcus sp. G-MC3 TaxID=3046209 RepID=UPI0024B934C5|nr:hypothetical protein [Rhodococcus sp. G-MC3]MDJ0395010.1 hypothetical protein [Rhodococcus sp. G-MC3]
MKVGWHSQKYPPTGATAADGIRNQLGRPALSLLTVLVREAVQNSWDARIEGRQVEFEIEIKELRASMAPIWRRYLEAGAPTTAQLPLRGSLSKPLRLLSVSDRGTKGLGGPTRADNAVTGDTDFVSFVRNIGEPRSTEYGGGTYGFGKSIFYLVSKSATVLIHTRCATEGGFETRLIGCSMWKSYSVGKGLEGNRFTGRHWWGDDMGDVLEPLKGEDAEGVAKNLGLTPFRAEETGTTIVVIDPDLDGRESIEAAGWIADAMAWNLWPKMITKRDGSAPDIRFSVSCDGEQITVPDPATIRPLRLFVDAYRNMEGSEGQLLMVLKPKVQLGRLGLHKTMMPPFEPSGVSEECGFDRTSHHVCLMRTAELVVKYFQGPGTGSDSISYAGVFRSDAEVDQAYARSEPPTHDDWRSETLDGRDKTIVRTTYRRIRESLSKFVELKTSTPEATLTPLGAASRMFSPLVSAALGFGGLTASITTKNTGTSEAGDEPEDDGSKERQEPRDPSGAGRQDAGVGIDSSDGAEMDRDGDAGFGSNQSNPGAPTPGRHRRLAIPKVRYVGEPGIEDRNGYAVVVQRFIVPQHVDALVRADVSVSIPLAKGRETSAPVGAPQPVVLGWRSEIQQDDVLTLGRSLSMRGGKTVWAVFVKPAPDTVTSIELTVERAADKS